MVSRISILYLKIFRKQKEAACPDRSFVTYLLLYPNPAGSNRVISGRITKISGLPLYKQRKNC